MTAEDPTGRGDGPRQRRTLLVRRAAQLLLTNALFLAVLLVAAGTIAWWNAWAFAGEYLLIVVVNAWFVTSRNPEVIEARGRFHQGTRTFDRVLMAGYTVVYLGLFAVAGLDARRFGWAGLGWPWAAAGAVLLAASMIPIAGAMVANRNLETTVRIQTDRGHTVATGGPYRWVRHPMYLGMLVQLPATALLLGSAVAMVPAAVCVMILVARTALEDRTLQRDLPGYTAFTRDTRYRLVPRIW